MAVKFTKNETVSVPPDGEVTLKADADGILFTVASDGTESEVGADTQINDVVSDPLVAAATSIGLTGLDGEADGDYRIYFHILSVTGATGELKLQINDADTNLVSIRNRTVQSTDTTTATHSSTTCTISAGTAGADGTITGWIDVRSRTNLGLNRLIKASIFNENGYSIEETLAVYSDATTNITAIRILAANASRIGIGSYMMAHKLRHLY